MARVIGEAAVRLVVDGTGLSGAIRREVVRAIKETAAAHPFKDVEDEADSSSRRIGRLMGRLGDGAQGFARGIANAVSIGSRIAVIGAAAGAALAGISSLTNGVLQLIGVLVNASGAAALLPAALAGLVGVIATIKLGTQGVGDAFKALASGDAGKLNEALKKLAPSAQQFVRAAQAIKPAFDAMRLDVQQQLFRGLGVQLRLVAAAQLPVLRTGLSGIATELNVVATGVAHFLTSSLTVRQVASIFTNIRASIAAAGPAVTSFLDAFLNIGSVGASFLPQLANGFAVVAQRFSDFIARASASGQLAQFIQTGLDTLQQLGNVAANVFGIITDLLNAGTGTGGGLLNNLVQITAAIREFTSSAQGSLAINTFFESMRSVVQAVLPIVITLAKVFFTTLAPILANLAVTIGPAVNAVVQALGVALQNAAPGVAALGQGFAALISGIAPALPAIGQLASILGQGLGQVMAALGPVLGQLATVLATTLAQAIPPLIPIITQLVTLFGQVLVAVAPLIPPLIQLASAAIQPLITIVQALVPPFTDLINSVLAVMQPLIPIITDAFTQLGTALAPLAGALGDALVQIFQALSPVIQPLVQAIVALVQSVLPLIPVLTQIIQIVAPIIALFLQLSSTFIAFVVNAVIPLINAFTQINQVVSTVMQQILGVIQGVVSSVTGVFSGLLTSVTGTWSNITGTVSGAVGRVRDFIQNGFNAAVTAVRNAFNNVVNAVRSGIDTAVNFVAGLGGRILSALGNFGSLLFNAGADLLRGLINGIGSMIGSVINRVVDIGRNILGSIKSALGISSPSREMAKIGVFVGQGLVQGLESVQGIVADAASGLGSTIISKVQQPLGGVSIPGASGNLAGGATAGPSVLQQTNVMLPGTDVQQFANTVLSRAQTDFLSGASSLPVQRQGVQQGVSDAFLAGVVM